MGYMATVPSLPSADRNAGPAFAEAGYWLTSIDVSSAVSAIWRQRNGRSRKGTASEIARAVSNGIEKGAGGIALAHLIKLTSSRGSADDE